MFVAHEVLLILKLKLQMFWHMQQDTSKYVTLLNNINPPAYKLLQVRATDTDTSIRVDMLQFSKDKDFAELSISLYYCNKILSVCQKVLCRP